MIEDPRPDDAPGSAGSDETIKARTILRLLQLHHRQQQELARVRDRLAQQTSQHVQRLIGAREADEDSSRSVESGSEWPALTAAATRVRELPVTLRKAISAKLPRSLREELTAAVYSFDALPELDPLLLQKVIQRANKRELAIALLGAPDACFQAVTGNMSRRAARMLKEDMESLLASGELSTRDVHDARAGLSSVIQDAWQTEGRA